MKDPEQVMDALLPDIEHMTREEADQLFAETGADLQAVMARLETVKQQARGTGAKS